MGFPSVLTMAHRFVADRLRPGDTAVDATIGGGNDTAFLAKAVGHAGHVYGFDIQQAAIDATRSRLTATAPDTPLTLFLAGHERMAELLPSAVHGKAAVVMFNLGYLPGDDDAKDVVTKPETTIAALDAAFGLLRPGGVLTVAVYPGHPGGREEADAVDDWFRQLPPAEGQAIVYRMTQKAHAPYLLAAERKS